MASQSGDDDAGCPSRGILQELRARDLPSKRLLGKGLASVAYETEWNGMRFARKDFVGVPSGSFQKEASILVSLDDHENVVKTHGWIVGKVSCSLVLEYVEEDLQDLLQKRKESQKRPADIASGNQSERNHTYPFKLAEALDIVLQIARGMEFLHAHHISHGDLKTKNILVSHTNDGDRKSLSVEVADFGLVRTKSKSISYVSRQARKLDMVQWQAPEILEELLLEYNEETSSESDSDLEEDCAGPPRVIHGRAADVYSFAVTCSQILTGEDPYPSRNWKELGRKIVSGELRPNIPTRFPPFLKELLESCWTKVPAERPTFSSIVALLNSQQVYDIRDLTGRQLLSEDRMKPICDHIFKEKPYQASLEVNPPENSTGPVQTRTSRSIRRNNKHSQARFGLATGRKVKRSPPSGVLSGRGTLIRHTVGVAFQFKLQRRPIRLPPAVPNLATLPSGTLLLCLFFFGFSFLVFFL